MKTQILKAITAVILATTWGCSVNNRQQLVEAGRTPLDAESLYTLVADHSLQLTAIDFDAQIYFQENGRMSAISREGEKDTGSWDITSENMLCLDFAKWYFSDLKCYSVIAGESENAYMFFTTNGARYYTAEQLAETPERLRTIGSKKGKSSSYLEQRRAQTGQPSPVSDSSTQQSVVHTPAPEPSQAEMKHLLITTAQNCPACNLAGVDLSHADLVGANLAGTNLSGASLRGANLRRANLSGANLSDADMRATNLPGANLTKSNLKNADLSGANLVKANLTGSATDGIILQDALLEGTTGIK